MDPQTVAFSPQNDIWRFQADMLRLQQTQTDHAERLLRLERRQEEDSRVKSVWGTSSPFPSVLSGTPQYGEKFPRITISRASILKINNYLGPVNRPPADTFDGFDDQSTNLIGSLQLDTDDEPRRIGASSRANSVRFDESANQGHWAHPSRSSIDIIPRTGSSLSAHPMIERTYSHKSDGRQSSAGVSVHSAISGRANSLGIDTPFSGLGGASPLETPGLAPGLFMLGPVPSIIRCWLTTSFKHDSMLYAAVCTGSYGSYLDQRLVDHLDLSRLVRQDGDTSKLKLSIYLPEAVTRGRAASSRSNSPAPQLPSLTVDFTVVDKDTNDDDKVIQVFIGSDVLRTHNADVLFSSNSIILYDDDHIKVSIPMVRPEDERSFNSLFVVSSPIKVHGSSKGFFVQADESVPLEGLAQSQPIHPSTKSPTSTSKPSPQISANQKPHDVDSTHQDDLPPSNRQSFEKRAPPGLLNTNNTTTTSTQDPPKVAENTPNSGLSPPGSSTWGPWRRDNTPDKFSSQSPSIVSAGGEWAKAGSTYQRRETGIKVLRPAKSGVTRAFSSAQTPGLPSNSPASQSRFFDDGKRRASLEGMGEQGGRKTGESEARKSSTGASTSASASVDGKDSEKGMGSVTGTKTRSNNPIGSASAFAWMNK